MSDQTTTPAEVIARVEGNGDDMYLTLPIGREVAEDILAALTAAGFRVERVPDDQTVAEVEELALFAPSELVSPPADRPRSHR